MSRVPSLTIQEAPEASRPVQEGLVPFSPTGKLPNPHAQMAHSPPAAASGWSSEQLTEAFAYLGLTVFTAYFLNYARTPLDLPTDTAGAEG